MTGRGTDQIQYRPVFYTLLQQASDQTLAGSLRGHTNAGKIIRVQVCCLNDFLL
jgi:hypothetical protein